MDLLLSVWVVALDVVVSVASIGTLEPLMLHMIFGGRTGPIVQIFKPQYV